MRRRECASEFLSQRRRQWVPLRPGAVVIGIGRGIWLCATQKLNIAKVKTRNKLTFRIQIKDYLN